MEWKPNRATQQIFLLKHAKKLHRKTNFLGRRGHSCCCGKKGQGSIDLSPPVSPWGGRSMCPLLLGGAQTSVSPHQVERDAGGTKHCWKPSDDPTTAQEGSFHCSWSSLRRRNEKQGAGRGKGRGEEYLIGAGRTQARRMMWKRWKGREDTWGEWSKETQRNYL